MRHSIHTGTIRMKNIFSILIFSSRGKREVISISIDSSNHHNILFSIDIAFAMIFSTILPRLGFLFAAINLHNALLNSITHAPMQFFDQTPVGRVLSRLSQDVGVLDSALPFSIFNCLTRFYEVTMNVMHPVLDQNFNFSPVYV